MIKKKSRFLTFCFSVIPGAGHMYQGFIKQGTMLMTMFFGLIALAIMFGISLLGLLAIIVWFVSFFDANNKAALSQEEFYTLEDKYFFNLDNTDLGKFLESKQRFMVAIIAILLGVYVLWINFTSLLFVVIPEQFKDVLYWNGLKKLPQVLFALVVIGLGVWLIRGKKEALNKEEDVTEDMVAENTMIEKVDNNEQGQ